MVENNSQESVLHPVTDASRKIRYVNVYIKALKPNSSSNFRVHFSCNCA